ncbi:DUF3099 domain-containing protein [Nocardioides zeae]|uniref:DUF3099 domain-containing protein n=1 Tax=Nocardioides imazamoxiresistens TaxID=3231893 RepID=A0ABU3PYX2_9ACTN|nr:DUF3099 domain-containing protein [Nocardioides zeae]MDT9593997.1 DUF3099 domain-containing protein [Nocardioides zeae]
MAVSERRRHAYVAMMATCVGLFVLGAAFGRHLPFGLTMTMFVVAALIPPFAAVVANAGALQDDDAADPDGPDDPDRPDPYRGIEDR